MTNGLFALAVFLIALGILVAATIIYLAALGIDYVFAIPAHYTAGTLGGIGLGAFFTWAVIETTALTELGAVVGGVVGVLIAIPITAAAVILYIVRTPSREDTLRYAVGSWGPSAASFLIVLVVSSTQVDPTPLVYVAATAVMLLVASGTAVMAYDSFH